MKLTYFGTAAAEGFPAVFCNCDYCNEARKAGGKNIRTRSQSLINEDLLVDFPADTYAHFLSNNICAHKIRYLLITHSHSDHLYPTDLLRHKKPYAHQMETEELQVFCPEGAYKAIEAELRDHTGFRLHKVQAFEPFNLGSYWICPLPARHYAGDNAMIYIIRGDKTLLYAHDTGYFHEEVFAYIQENKIRFDMISMDCTNVDIPVSNTGSHMGVPNILEVTARLEEMGAVDEKTVKYINHFSHNGNPMQDVLEQRMAPYGYRVAYDGCGVEF